MRFNFHTISCRNCAVLNIYSYFSQRTKYTSTTTVFFGSRVNVHTVFHFVQSAWDERKYTVLLTNKSVCNFVLFLYRGQLKCPYTENEYGHYTLTQNSHTALTKKSRSTAQSLTILKLESIESQLELIFSWFGAMRPSRIAIINVYIYLFIYFSLTNLFKPSNMTDSNQINKNDDNSSEQMNHEKGS